MPDPLSWIIIVLCLLAHFFFSSAETALACCNHYKMKVLAEENSSRAKLVLKATEKYDRALTALLIGSNIMAVTISSLSTLLFVRYLNGKIDSSLISLISSASMAFLVYLFGDTLPKTIAKAIPDTLSLWFIYPVIGIMYLLFPLTVLFEKLTQLMNRIFRVKKETISEEELTDAVHKAGEDKEIKKEQIELVRSALKFDDKKVSEVLTPREKIFALNLKGLTHQQLQEILLSTNYSRIPVYDKVFDNVVGVLNTKVYFEEVSKDPHVDLRTILQKPYFISENVLLDDLFHGFKKKRTHLALIRDSHKHITGMVTMEDVLEELVSDISEPDQKGKA